MKMKIILNADDFGKSIERNRAIDDSFKQGLISSASLIVTGKHLQEAVNFINKGGYADKVHLHVNLSTNLLHEDPEDIPLTERMSKDKLFCKDGKFIKYKGLPRRFSNIRKWKIVYDEIVAQYRKFIEVTEGKGDYTHIDFHLWYNLTWPVSVALNVFARKFKIKSVRYISMHNRRLLKYIPYRIICWNPRVKSISCSSIDYYITKYKSILKEEVFELYCHPNYKEGVLLDDTPSLFQHDRQPLIEHIQKLKALDSFEFVSWKDVK